MITHALRPDRVFFSVCVIRPFLSETMRCLCVVSFALNTPIKTNGLRRWVSSKADCAGLGKMGFLRVRKEPPFRQSCQSAALYVSRISRAHRYPTRTSLLRNRANRKGSLPRRKCSHFRRRMHTTIGFHRLGFVRCREFGCRVVIAASLSLSCLPLLRRPRCLGRRTRAKGCAS